MKLIACISLAIAAYQSIAAQATVPPVLPSYELYSWQAKDGAWNYSLIVSPSGASVSEETIFDRKFRVQGTGVLEAKLAKLIPGANVYWLDGLSSGHAESISMPNLRYPPPATIRDVRYSAQSRHLKLQMLASAQTTNPR
ncbi:MAG: hypothetical protein WA414_07500 [Acidobacteriaceae bacterium]